MAATLGAAIRGKIEGYGNPRKGVPTSFRGLRQPSEWGTHLVSRVATALPIEVPTSFRGSWQPLERGTHLVSRVPPTLAMAVAREREDWRNRRPGVCDQRRAFPPCRRPRRWKVAKIAISCRPGPKRDGKSCHFCRAAGRKVAKIANTFISVFCSHGLRPLMPLASRGHLAARDVPDAQGLVMRARDDATIGQRGHGADRAPLPRGPASRCSCTHGEGVIESPGGAGCRRSEKDPNRISRTDTARHGRQSSHPHPRGRSGCLEAVRTVQRLEGTSRCPIITS